MTHPKHFPVFDANSHVVESPEIWETYLDTTYRALGKFSLWREEGHHDSYLKINGEAHHDRVNPNIPRHAIWRPGMTWEQIGNLDPETRHPINEGASNPQTRLQDMDAMGVDQALLYPTWFAEGFPLVQDPDTANALAQAYNNWIADFCQTAPDRLYATAIIPLQNMDYALAELRRVASVPCFRAAFLRPMFIQDRYYTHPYYDPFWAELERLNLTLAVHPATGLWNPEWTSHAPFIEKISKRLNQVTLFREAGGGPFAGGGNGPNFTFGAQQPIGHPVAPILSPWLDNHMFVASALIGFTVMQRFPKLQVIMAGGQASWMEEVLEKMEASTLTIPPLHHYPVRTDVEEMWEEGHVLLAFDAEERLIQKLPATFAHKIVWGSRYPQQDTTSAWDAIETLRRANVEEASMARMFGSNAAEQLGVDLAITNTTK